ncbi:MAG: toll/interleukin-1 receptor domain-containing protein [Magnetococcales bacterium]|nr:toll/interleukin-1 receptor domain-containing protein [Magnetococcales bacterium]MBF0438225.1 toll/interleukin-1 receptor domain-containing protein [Magnetococcales bacterium]
MLNIFISYAHEDEAFKNDLLTHLKGLERQKKILPWQDGLLEVGGDWRPQIQKAMDGCHMALFLVSPSFIASDFIDSEEVSRLMKRRETDNICVIPILIRPCNWKFEKYEGIQFLPENGKAVISFPKSNGKRDEIWVKITEAIAKFAETIPATSNDFLTEYRRCFANRFSSWDLAHAGVVQGGGARKPIEASLEAMFTPLRMGTGYNPEKLDEGVEITPDILLEAERSCVP